MFREVLITVTKLLPCILATDKPALSLQVETRTDSVVNNLQQGSRNPFAQIGIESIKIINKIQACIDGDRCSGADLDLNRGEYKPDIVAFYHPSNDNETGKYKQGQ